MSGIIFKYSFSTNNLYAWQLHFRGIYCATHTSHGFCLGHTSIQYCGAWPIYLEIVHVLSTMPMEISDLIKYSEIFSHVLVMKIDFFYWCLELLIYNWAIVAERITLCLYIFSFDIHNIFYVRMNSCKYIMISSWNWFIFGRISGFPTEAEENALLLMIQFILSHLSPMIVLFGSSVSIARLKCHFIGIGSQWMCVSRWQMLQIQSYT